MNEGKDDNFFPRGLAMKSLSIQLALEGCISFRKKRAAFFLLLFRGKT